MENQFKGTPGPWTVISTKKNKYGVTVNEIGAQGVTGLASVYEPNNKDFEPDYVHGSNSRLIEVAPDMLAALIEFVELGKRPQDDHDNRDYEAYQNAKLILNKALGK